MRANKGQPGLRLASQQFFFMNLPCIPCRGIITMKGGEVLTDHNDCHCAPGDEELRMQPDKSPAQPRTSEEKQKIINRLKRAEGQIRGLQKMVEEDRYCVDILIQISAVQAALKKIGFSVLERHTKSCVYRAIDEGHGSEQIDELLKVLKQFYK